MEDTVRLEKERCLCRMLTAKVEKKDLQMSHRNQCDSRQQTETLETILEYD